MFRYLGSFLSCCSCDPAGVPAACTLAPRWRQKFAASEMAIRARLAWSSWQFPPIPQSHASYCALLEALRLPHACPPSLGPTEHVLSLGSACFTARFLQQQRLRTHASPFDWVFSSAQMVTHCIESNFASLLDTAEYQRLAGGSVGHRTYSSMAGHAAIFNHHDPLGSEADLAYFARCAERFEASLRAPGHKLFLLVTREPAAAALAPLRALLAALCSRSSNFEILAVCLECRAVDASVAPEPMRPAGGPTVALEAEEVRDGGGYGDAGGGTLRVYTLRCVGGFSGLAFGDSADAACFESLVMRQPADAAIPWLDDAGCRRRSFALAPPQGKLGPETTTAMLYDRVRDRKAEGKRAEK